MLSRWTSSFWELGVALADLSQRVEALRRAEALAVRHFAAGAASALHKYDPAAIGNFAQRPNLCTPRVRVEKLG